MAITSVTRTTVETATQTDFSTLQEPRSQRLRWPELPPSSTKKWAQRRGISIRCSIIWRRAIPTCFTTRRLQAVVSPIAQSMCRAFAITALSSPNSLTGGLAGYAVTAGYDLATGLGSLDVANFLAAASSTSHPGVAVTTLTVHGSATTISYTQTTTFTATVSSNTPGVPTGTVQFYSDGNALGAPVNISSGTATTAALPFTSAGTYYITAVYSGDSKYAASTAPGFTLTVTGLSSSATLMASNSAIPIGTNATFSVTVAECSGSPKPTGSVWFLVHGTQNGDYFGQVQLTNGIATTPPLNFPAMGSYTATAQYLGDAVYSLSTSAPLTFTITKGPSTTTLSYSWIPQNIGIGGGMYYAASARPTTTSTAQKPPPAHCTLCKRSCPRISV